MDGDGGNPPLSVRRRPQRAPDSSSKGGRDLFWSPTGKLIERDEIGPDEDKLLALVVEDDEDASLIAASMLALLGFETLQAASAHEALMILANQKPTLLVLDICLPDFDGPDLLQIIRRLREHADTPVLVVSAVHPSDADATAHMREHGILGFLSKPFSLKRLQDAINDLLS